MPASGGRGAVCDSVLSALYEPGELSNRGVNCRQGVGGPAGWNSLNGWKRRRPACTSILQKAGGRTT